MAHRLSFDTTFLIDLQRERTLSRRGTEEQPDGPAHSFLRLLGDAELFLSIVALGEFAEGFGSFDHPTVAIVRDRHTLLPADEKTASIYAGAARELRSRGELIGTNDLWIGCSSLRYRLPVVTANVQHFQRIARLDVISYRP